MEWKKYSIQTKLYKVSTDFPININPPQIYIFGHKFYEKVLKCLNFLFRFEKRNLKNHDIFLGSL